MSIGEYCQVYKIPWAKIQPLAGVFTDQRTGNLCMNLEFDTEISDVEWKWFLREWYRWV